MCRSQQVFPLRISPEMLDTLQQWANDEFRSINGQIEYILYEALSKACRLKSSKTQPTDPPEDEF